MKTKTIALSLVPWFVGAAVCFAANTNMMGTWKLNGAKSKLGPGAPKNNTVVYEAAGDNGKGKFDGKDYPVTGDPTSDVRSYTNIDDRTLGFNVKKGGKVTTSGRIVISTDGKSRTVTASGTDPSGQKFHTTSVYDKK
jgi:hypothetical protein